MTKYVVNGEAIYQAIRKPATSLLVADSADKCKAACEGDSAEAYDALRGHTAFHAKGAKR